MSVLFLVPALGYGLILLALSADATLLWLSLVTIAAWWWHERTKRFDLSQPVSFIADRVWIGERRLSLFALFWGSAIRNRVYAAAFWEDPIKNLDAVATFGSHIGVTATGQLICQPISNRTPHALLIGPSGTGKTELMRLIASQLEAEIWGIDYNGGVGLAGFTGLALIATEQDDSALDVMSREFLARKHRALQPKLLIVVDDLERALEHEAVALLLRQVASQGRVLNVMLLAANQTLGGVPRSIWVNCANRFSLGADLASRVELGFRGRSEAAFGDWGAAELIQGSRVVSFRFPLGFRNEKTAPAQAEAVNPLLSRVSSRPE